MSMTNTHSLVGELISADLNVQAGLPTLTLHLKQFGNRYSNQRITAVRGYPSTLAGGRMACHHHADLRVGTRYRLEGDGLGIGQQTGVVYLLGLCGVREVESRGRTYPAPHAAEPNSLAAEGACAGLAMSMPQHLQPLAVAP